MSDNYRRSGLLIVNLGTPEAPTAPAVRRYLAEFLADPRVVELPRAVWLPILYGVILPLRSPRSAKLYARIWTAAGSPLKVHTQAIGDALAERLDRPVVVAMRYGQPTIAAGLDSLLDQGVEELTVLPLYPQYSATTTASVFDAVAAELTRRRALPSLRFIARYWDHPAWQRAAADKLKSELPPNTHLLFSFHGIPQRCARAGDPYPEECVASAAAIAARAGVADYSLSYQSRFGREPWLQPYTDATLIRLAEDGVRRVAVYCPGFAVDCLETLEEIAMENREVFLAAGGEEYRYIPCLNADPGHVAALAEIVCEER